MAARVGASIPDVSTARPLGLAGQRKLLLCLDDVHWADETTLSWLQFIMPRLSQSGLTLLATYRSNEAEPLAALLRTARWGWCGRCFWTIRKLWQGFSW